MQNHRFPWKVFVIAIVGIIIITGSILYWDSQPPGLACLSPKCGPTPPSDLEKMSFNSFQVNSPTNVTLTLTNTGNLSWMLAEYFVKDSNGNTYSNSTWAGPIVNPRATATVIILLNGKLTGQPFQFQSGHIYTITLVTARNDPFPYTFTA